MLCADSDVPLHLQAHLGPIIAIIAAISAPALLESKNKLKAGLSLPTALYLTLTTAALAWGRLVLFDILQLVLGYPPSAGLLAGASLVALAMAQIPLLEQRYPHSQSPRRAMAAVAAFGVMLALLRPPLPEKVRLLLCKVAAICSCMLDSVAAQLVIRRTLNGQKQHL